MLFRTMRNFLEEDFARSSIWNHFHRNLIFKIVTVFPGKGVGLGFSLCLPGPWPLDRGFVLMGSADIVWRKNA